ncbi:YbaB/EbfC family nucleoid-associated protein [Tessaracoccus sp. SD287]|uniref:YbaB/EbfC family nucleoid-associated protein n=1 Tax=Tessaracoccus sp. SD287 TaxID=2782008 RepID=UPI001A975872|nr:YbaB/EbfC family nucleoid-associated protein [Tessaracoccus sp. SD287]MBO1031598.1 YbaB/EbfC family nucleoid-associated protein [Tessaracoccus sp. SD287]
MTSWREVADLNLDDEFDELDPMTAPSASFGEEEPEEADALEHTGPWTAARGFSDPHGAVRVWVDETVTINKVRMSPSWRDRVGKQGLEAAFGLVFLQINNYFRDLLPAESLAADDRTAKRPLHWDTMWELCQRNERIRSQLAQLGPESDGRWVGQSATGVAPDRSVAITLNVHGQLERIEFGKQWLEAARIRQISDAVVRAHQDAKAQFVPPTYEPGERDRLQHEMSDNRHELLAMMRRGFK